MFIIFFKHFDFLLFLNFNSVLGGTTPGRDLFIVRDFHKQARHVPDGITLCSVRQSFFYFIFFSWLMWDRRHTEDRPPALGQQHQRSRWMCIPGFRLCREGQRTSSISPSFFFFFFFFKGGNKFAAVKKLLYRKKVDLFLSLYYVTCIGATNIKPSPNWGPFPNYMYHTHGSRHSSELYLIWFILWFVGKTSLRRYKMSPNVSWRARQVWNRVFLSRKKGKKNLKNLTSAFEMFDFLSVWCMPITRARRQERKTGKREEV